MSLTDARLQVLGLIEANATTRELLTRFSAFERALLETCRSSGLSATDVLQLTLADRRLAVDENARGAAALADFDVEGALRHVVRAMLADPTNRDARANHAMLVPLLNEPAAYSRIRQMMGPSTGDSSTLLRSRGRSYASDLFRVPLEPFPLDGRRKVAFLYRPRWSSADWFEPIAAYARAFEPNDDVTLVIWTDAQAQERILAALTAENIDPTSMADMLLVRDDLDSDAEARLYATVDWVVPNGDSAQFENALWAGASILDDPRPEYWRAASPRRKVDVECTSRAPRVSCLVITYNYGHYLPDALDSVLAQDYPAESLEIIVIDDGSTDDTPRVVKPYLDRVRYVQKSNGGLKSAMSRGIEEATGEFIAILDGDDTWPVDKTRRQVERLLARPEAGLVYGDMTLIDAAGGMIHPSFFEHHNVTPLRGDIYAALNKWNFIAGGSMMVRASLKDQFYPIAEQAPFPDWWIVLQVSKVAPVELIGGSVYNYRYHGSNMGLMASGAKQGKQCRLEIPLRRWLLANAPGERLTLQDLLEAYMTFEQIANQGSQLLELPIRELVPVSGAESTNARLAFEEAIAADQAGDKERALRHVIRSVALDPWHEGGRGVVRQLVNGLSERFGGIAA